MSGWIKIDKGLSEQIRFKRVVRKIRESNALPGVTDRDASLLETLCVGALVRLWIYADSHIDDDNTIVATFDEIDELVGLPGFAAALPSDWLKVIDEDRVELPDFLEHNGSSARQRKDNAKRQAKWRENNKSRDVTKGVTGRNARNAARPDQTRPDQSKEQALAEARAVAGLDIKSFDRFVAYREERKPAIKSVSLVDAAKTLAKFGTQQADVVTNSIANGYQGLIAPKDGGKKPQGYNPYAGAE
jgi:hypothetical protein